MSKMGYRRNRSNFRAAPSEIPGLQGFSPSNIKNMRIFFEQWAAELEPSRQLPTVDLENGTEKNKLILFRQLPTAELGEENAGFLQGWVFHHREILRKCKTADERWYYILRCANEFWSVDSNEKCISR